MRVIIVTGLSGSGKSVALHTLEDEDFYCVDNLPAAMLPELLQRLSHSNGPRHEKVAVGIDARGQPESIGELINVIDSLNARQRGDQQQPGAEPEAVPRVEILFLETDQEILLKRFSETRRKHPLTRKGTPLTSAIREENEVLQTLKEQADLVIDTSTLNLHQLRENILQRMVGGNPDSLSVLFQSFGFKYGQPRSTDFVFDVRCLPNPYWDPAIRAYTGVEQPIIDYLEGHQSVRDMYESIRDFVERWLPVFEKENRSYLTLSIGCTGGRHRSVYMVNQLQQHFSKSYDNVSVRHRELT